MKSLWIVITFDITDMKRYFFHGYFQENVDFLDISDKNENRFKTNGSQTPDFKL